MYPVDKNDSMRSYMTTNKTTGFANYIKAQKGYERDYYLTGNITEPRGVKTATARS